MSFFPRELMPLTPKRNSPTSSGSPARITAEEFNMHDQEIRAMEEFIGVQPTTTSEGIPRAETAEKAGQTSIGSFQAGLMGLVGQMTDKLNSFALDGISVMSGYVSKGGLIIFPQDIGTTYLTQAPSPSDTDIHVSNTIGFPAKGIISIINDVRQSIESDGAWSRRGDDTTLVEWIRYSGKTSSSFTGCQRGFMGTMKGPHGGNIEFPIGPQSSDDLNKKDVSMIWQSLTDVTTRRYRGWRNLTMYAMPILSLSGSKDSITDAVRLLASTFRVSTGYDAKQLALFVASANTVGILGTRSSGTYYLKSADPSHASDGDLTPSEASDFVGEAISKGIMGIVSKPDDLEFPLASIPVFQGKMGISISPAIVGTIYPIDGVQVFLDAMGRLLLFNEEDRSLEAGSFGLIGYSIFHVPSLRSTTERNT